jgi:hypothetical protein
MGAVMARSWHAGAPERRSLPLPGCMADFPSGGSTLAAPVAYTEYLPSRAEALHSVNIVP